MNASSYVLPNLTPFSPLQGIFDTSRDILSSIVECITMIEATADFAQIITTSIDWGLFNLNQMLFDKYPKEELIVLLSYLQTKCQEYRALKDKITARVDEIITNCPAVDYNSKVSKLDGSQFETIGISFCIEKAFIHRLRQRSLEELQQSDSLIEAVYCTIKQEEIFRVAEKEMNKWELVERLLRDYLDVVPTAHKFLFGSIKSEGPMHPQSKQTNKHFQHNDCFMEMLEDTTLIKTDKIQQLLELVRRNITSENPLQKLTGIQHLRIIFSTYQISGHLFADSFSGEIVTEVIDLFINTPEEHTAIQMEAIWVLGYIAMMCYVNSVRRRIKSFLKVKNHSKALYRLTKLLSSTNSYIAEQVPWVFHHILSNHPIMGLEQILVYSGGIRELLKFAETHTQTSSAYAWRQTSFTLLAACDLLVPHDPKERFPTFLQLSSYFISRIMMMQQQPSCNDIETTLRIDCNGLRSAIQKGKQYWNNKEGGEPQQLSKKYDHPYIAKRLVDLLKPSHPKSTDVEEIKRQQATATDTICSLIDFDTRYIQWFLDANLLYFLRRIPLFDCTCACVKKILQAGTEAQIQRLFDEGVMLHLLTTAKTYTGKEWIQNTFFSLLPILVAGASQTHFDSANTLGYFRLLIDYYHRASKSYTEAQKKKPANDDYDFDEPDYREIVIKELQLHSLLLQMADRARKLKVLLLIIAQPKKVLKLLHKVYCPLFDC